MKIVSAILGTALVVVGAAAIHFWREAGAGRQQIAHLQAQLQERDARFAALAVSPVIQPAASIAATPATTPGAASGSSAASTPPAIASALSDITAMVRAQMSSPEGIAQRRQLARTLMERSNPDIGEAIGLTPDQTAKLLDLLAAHQDGLSSVFTSGAGNTAATAQERAAALREQQQAQEAELQALLGSKYPQWQDYRETRAVWQQRRDLRAVLDASGTPLTEAQGRSLITALSVEQRSINQQMRDVASQGRPPAEAMARHTPERRQQLLQAAAPHLSPQQLDGYRGMLERAAAQEQSILAPMRAIQAGGAAAAPR